MHQIITNIKKNILTKTISQTIDNISLVLQEEMLTSTIWIWLHRNLGQVLCTCTCMKHN